MAGAAGFEPATLGFGDRCSDQTELRSCKGPCIGNFSTEWYDGQTVNRRKVAYKPSSVPNVRVGLQCA